VFYYNIISFDWFKFQTIIKSKLSIVYWIFRKGHTYIILVYQNNCWLYRSTKIPSHYIGSLKFLLIALVHACLSDYMMGFNSTNSNREWTKRPITSNIKLLNVAITITHNVESPVLVWDRYKHMARVNR
jgi:hypothetical protein